jgi:hypothetical protein
VSAEAAVIPATRVERACRVTEWKPWPYGNGSLIGHVTVNFSGWTIHHIPVFRTGDGSLSVGTPTKPEIDAEGRVRLRDGKRMYTSVISFETADARERWQRSILAALAAAGIGSEPTQNHVAAIEHDFQKRPWK